MQQGASSGAGATAMPLLLPICLYVSYHVLFSISISISSSIAIIAIVHLLFAVGNAGVCPAFSRSGLCCRTN